MTREEMKHRIHFISLFLILLIEIFNINACRTSRKQRIKKETGSEFIEISNINYTDIASAQNENSELIEVPEEPAVPEIEELTTEYDIYRDVEPKKEKGRLGGLTRDFIKGLLRPLQAVRGQINKWAGKIGLSRSSKGLDTDTGFFSGVIDDFKKAIKLIYPGTHWCGDGDRSKNFEDLGMFSDTDKCCRGHDMCFDTLMSGETKYGLKNTGLFTRSHCDCDEEFYKCLKEVKSVISYKIGVTYFSILGPQCFREDYPILRCVEYVTDERDNQKCIKYEKDMSATPEYQWFDSPSFFRSSRSTE